MAEKKDKKEINIVDQNAIWRETIRKENRCQKLYTQYHINPYKPSNQVSGNFFKNWVILEKNLGKPNSRHDAADGEEDAEFLNIIHKVRVEPRKKYSEPITETQVRSRENKTKTNWPDLTFLEIHSKKCCPRSYRDVHIFTQRWRLWKSPVRCVR